MKKIGDVCWRASEASETVLGVDNAKSGICYWRASVAKIGDVYLFIDFGMFIYLFIGERA